MLNEALGKSIPPEDLVHYIKQGLSPGDREAVRTDLERHPTATRLLAEFERLDEIRGPSFASVVNAVIHTKNKTPTPSITT